MTNSGGSKVAYGGFIAGAVSLPVFYTLKNKGISLDQGLLSIIGTYFYMAVSGGMIGAAASSAFEGLYSALQNGFNSVSGNRKRNLEKDVETLD